MPTDQLSCHDRIRWRPNRFPAALRRQHPDRRFRRIRRTVGVPTPQDDWLGRWPPSTHTLSFRKSKCMIGTARFQHFECASIRRTRVDELMKRRVVWDNRL